jgi:hypothetical protein
VDYQKSFVTSDEAKQAQINMLRLLDVLSVSEAADMLGVSRQTIYGWRDGNAPTRYNCERISDLVRTLLSREDVPGIEKFAHLIGKAGSEWAVECNATVFDGALGEDEVAELTEWFEAAIIVGAKNEKKKIRDKAGPYSKNVTKFLSDLPENCVYVWYNAYVSKAIKQVAMVGRTDITVVGPKALTCGDLNKIDFDAIVIDGRAKLTASQQKAYTEIVQNIFMKQKVKKFPNTARALKIVK